MGKTPPSAIDQGGGGGWGGPQQRRIYMHIPMEMLNDYDACKDEILTSLGDTVTQAEKQWHNLSIKPGDDWNSIATILSSFKIGCLVHNCKTMSEMSSALCLLNFIRYYRMTMPPEFGHRNHRMVLVCWEGLPNPILSINLINPPGIEMADPTAQKRSGRLSRLIGILILSVRFY